MYIASYAFAVLSLYVIHRHQNWGTRGLKPLVLPVTLQNCSFSPYKQIVLFLIAPLV